MGNTSKMHNMLYRKSHKINIELQFLDADENTFFAKRIENYEITACLPQGKTVLYCDK